MREERFDVRLDPDALKEYEQLDGSVLELVTHAIDELMYGADEIGKRLSNHQETKLAGCKEIKFRDAGIRIVFRVTNEAVEVLQIVYVLTIEKRVRDKAFKHADRRYSAFRKIPKDKLRLFLNNHL